MKIISEKVGITHSLALCLDCGWSESNHGDRQWLRRMVAMHIRATGHTVSIETAYSIRYSAAANKTTKEIEKSGYAEILADKE
ncbi:MAG: hypothetical protein ACOYYF_04550 [Chloroflexota bacterium]|jgi:hypothetical protein